MEWVCVFDYNLICARFSIRHKVNHKDLYLAAAATYRRARDAPGQRVWSKPAAAVSHRRCGLCQSEPAHTHTHEQERQDGCHHKHAHTPAARRQRRIMNYVTHRETYTRVYAPSTILHARTFSSSSVSICEMKPERKSVASICRVAISSSLRMAALSDGQCVSRLVT